MIAQEFFDRGANRRFNYYFDESVAEIADFKKTSLWRSTQSEPFATAPSAKAITATASQNRNLTYPRAGSFTWVS